MFIHEGEKSTNKLKVRYSKMGNVIIMGKEVEAKNFMDFSEFKAWVHKDMGGGQKFIGLIMFALPLIYIIIDLMGRV